MRQKVSIQVASWFIFRRVVILLRVSDKFFRVIISSTRSYDSYLTRRFLKFAKQILIFEKHNILRSQP
jgi:hypothetical protein